MELEQHCSHASGGGIHFHNERELGIRMGEDGPPGPFGPLELQGSKIETWAFYGAWK